MNPSDEIKCNVTDIGTKWLIEVSNFGTYKGDGWFIIEADM